MSLSGRSATCTLAGRGGTSTTRSDRASHADSTAHMLATLHATPMVAVVGDHASPFVETVDRAAFDDSRVTSMPLVPH